MKFSASLRQLWAESKANPGFTSLYVGGVAFAVAFTMVFTIIYYVHLAPIYPEYNRGTTYYINNITAQNNTTNNMRMGSVSKEFIDKYIASSENIEYYTAYIYDGGSAFIQPADNSGDFMVVTRYTDPNFFRLYGYEFLEGRPFDEAEFTSAINNVVIDSYIAKRLFGSPERALGQEVSLDFKPYKVVGIVRSSSPVTYTSYANIFLPYTILEKVKAENSHKEGDARDMNGSFFSTIKFKDEAHAKKFRAEINEKARRMNMTDTAGWQLNVEGSLLSHTVKTLSKGGRTEESSSEFFRPLLLVLFVLLIIPAINISGMIGGQMDRRLSEIGIRRSFGATRGELTRQVMIENLVMTIIGGIIGLIAAWIIVIICRNWLLQILIQSWELPNAPEAVSVSPELVFSPSIFIFTLLICIILNLLSAYIPVRMSLRHPIVSSLNTKR